MTPHLANGIRSFRRARPAESTPSRTVIHVVDLDDCVRLALSQALTLSGMELRVHSSLGDFLRAHQAECPGCLVIDAQVIAGEPMPAGVRCPTVVMAHKTDFDVVVSAMKSGAVDVVEKPLCARKLAAAVGEAIEIDRQRRLAESRHDIVRARFATLTPREKQVMALVTMGMLNKQVGADLDISEITVKAHRGSVMRKMEARSLADLVRMADVIGEPLTSLSRTGSSQPTRSDADGHLHNGCSSGR